MMMKALIYLSLILLPILAVVGSRIRVPPEMKPSDFESPDVADKSTIEIGKYAISEHNKKSKENLVFEKVLHGSVQEVSGKKYELVIAAKNGGVTKKYKVVVVEKLVPHSKTLESFIAY